MSDDKPDAVRPIRIEHRVWIAAYAAALPQQIGIHTMQPDVAAARAAEHADRAVVEFRKRADE